MVDSLTFCAVYNSTTASPASDLAVGASARPEYIASPGFDNHNSASASQRMKLSTPTASPSRRRSQRPKPASRTAAPTRRNAVETEALLTDLIQQEASLYAVTRDWRFDAASRKFVQLHKLLDEQFTAIGERLVRLSKHSRERGGGNSMGHADRVPTARGAPGELQAQIFGELLAKHQSVLAVLHGGTAQMAKQSSAQATTELLADLTAHHEKDASMLRALLREVKKTSR
jgi:DNA-binding ferritin-like protein